METNNVLITGASSGLGYATARQLAKRGVRRIFVTTTAAATAAGTAHRLSQETGCEAVGLALNLGSSASIDAFVQALQQGLGPNGTLSAIACNAGVQIVSGLKRNDEDLELTMAVNHFGHVRLLFLLWQQIATGANVVFVGSGTHDPEDKLARMFGFRGASFTSIAEWAAGTGDPRRSPAGRGLDRYANSKLANILTAFELTRRVSAARMRFCVLDPGLMPGTGLARNHNVFERAGWRVMRALIPLIPGASSPEDSAKIMADLLLGARSASTLEEHYLDFKGRLARRSPTVGDAAAAKRMFEQTLELLHLNPATLST